MDIRNFFGAGGAKKKKKKKKKKSKDNDDKAKRKGTAFSGDVMTSFKKVKVRSEGAKPQDDDIICIDGTGDSAAAAPVASEWRLFI